MRVEMAEWIATALFIGAGRQAGDGEWTVWASALAAVDEDGAEEIVQTILRSVDLGARAPTPALYLEHRRTWLRHQPDPVAVPDEPGRHRCACRDTGMVEVDATADTWRPCERCNLARYERWRKGSYMPRMGGGPGRQGTLGPSPAEEISHIRDHLAGVAGPPPDSGEQW